MKIKVLTVKGEPILIDVQNTETVKDIKKKIEQKTGMAPDEQKLIFGDKRLEDDKTIEESTLKHESVINLFSSDSIKVNVKGFVFEVSKNERIINLKTKIAEKINIAPHEQKLFFQESYLEDNKFVRNYPLTDGSTIKAERRLKDGLIIFVLTTDQTLITYEVPKTQRISYLKNLTYNNYGIVASQQKLSLRGVMLEDNKTFDEYQIRDGTVINIDSAIGRQLDIFVKTMDGKVLTFKVHIFDRIQSIKKNIQSKCGMAWEDITLAYEGHVLENDKTVGEYKIKDKSMLIIIAVLGGGMESIDETNNVNAAFQEN